MILLLDAYDSFVHNLARYLAEAGARVRVERSDALSVDAVLALRPSGIVLSPGPCTPTEAGVGLDLVRALAGPGGAPIPLLGVCLGHQVVAEALGASLEPARPPRHGVATPVSPTVPSPLLAGLPDPFPAGLYHSLSVSREGLPTGLRVTAVDTTGQIMAIEAVDRPLYGVQFHPESILTPGGRHLMANFLGFTRRAAA